jgi:formiminoglutamate deiminase
VIPGLANAHSHAFHRALRSRTQRDRGSFWTWRALMYAAADRLTPDLYRDLARAVYAEMALAGITVVGEFHYLHHAAGGRPYADPNAMGHAVIDAARDAGIRMTLLNTCYLTAGVDGTPLADGAQQRFGDRDGQRWAERAEALLSAADADVVIGAALHSVRAVPVPDMAAVVDWAKRHEAPLHVHSSEQTAEVDQCLAVHGCTPTALMREHGVLGERTTAVHATHLTDRDVADLHRTATGVCFCPTTERDLGDGVGPAPALLDGPGNFSLGSDSHAVIDLFEETRGVELDERLIRRERGVLPAARLLAAATADGHRALGWPDAGELRVGARGDLVAVDLDSVRTAGGGATVENVVFACTACRCHRRRDRRTSRRGRPDTHGHPRHRTRTGCGHSRGDGGPMSTLYTNIDELVTNDATLGDGSPLGIVTDAAIVVDDGRIAWVGPRAQAPDADERLDLDGGAVIPGFVDSHAHLVFAGDRSAEFAARMAGQRYDGGGIATTVSATRSATDEQLAANVGRLADELRRGGVTTFETKSGYGLSTPDEARSLRVAGEFTSETTFLGAHVVPIEYRHDREAYVRLVAGDMLAACRPHARWIDVFCEHRAFDVDETRVILEAGLAAGLTPRLHAGQLGPGDGIRLGVELGAASIDHCTYATDLDIEVSSVATPPWRRCCPGYS